MSIAEVCQLPVVVDLPTAGRALGLGRTISYQLARRGEFPCRVLRAGTAYRVCTADLLALLGLPLPSSPPAEGERDTPPPGPVERPPG
ncbi:DNA-binding protein [Spongiactinospora rosea]|uniref:DNA-binding protein n=1 Tax=Spongiactinospora rosea TaxID=2248750 RepID=UPI001CED1D65|nr:DNA-binding protein [Spongiactinospora rosea]